MNTVADLLRRTPRISTMTIHRYPLRNCYVPPSSPQYPTVAHLLSSYATVTLADSLRRWIDIAHAQHRRLRVDELNSVACRGKAGVSDTFASALWVTDALFSLARAGVDGVDMHTLPDAAYELFAFSRHGGRWHGSGPARLLRAPALRPGGARRCPAAVGISPRRRQRPQRVGHPGGRRRSRSRAHRRHQQEPGQTQDGGVAAAARRRAPRPPSSACWLPARTPSAA